MKPIRTIGIRRLRKYRRKNAALQISVFLSALLIGFFLLFGGQIPGILTDNPMLTTLPLEGFLWRWQVGMLTAAGILVLLGLLSVHLYGGIRREETQSLLAVLDSVGAVPGQRRTIPWMDTSVLFLAPMAAGFLLGSICGGVLFALLRRILGGTAGDVLSLVGILAGCLLLAALDGMIPYFLPSGKSVIRSIRTRNAEASEVRHGYRASKVFRGYTLTKRLGKKSVDFYNRTYRRIGWAFALALMIPLLGLLLFGHLAVGEVVLDANPFDGTDTTLAVGGIVQVLFGFLSVGFAFLTVSGVVGAVSLLRSQLYARRETERCYRAAGMTEKEFSRMLGYELKTAAALAMVILLFLAVIASGIFGMVMQPF